MGCFADLGWVWNVKPSTSLPTAELSESFVIWLDRTTNVFLEHLAAWGDAWTAQDFEHISISIMFFGGGLVGLAKPYLSYNTNTCPSAACSSNHIASEIG